MERSSSLLLNYFIIFMLIFYLSYSFLKKFWNTYDEFDKPVEDFGDKIKYGAICDPFIKSYGNSIEEYRNFCMKLVRNLGFYEPKTEFFNPTFERCHILYSWLYNKSSNPKIPDNIISESFADYIYHMERTVKDHKCSYALYNNTYVEQIKLNKLNIFHDNMEIIKGILQGQDGSQKNSCLKFVCECAKLYKDIYGLYCVNKDQTNVKHKITCLKLDQIKDSYKMYFTNQGSLNSIIPSLDNINDDYLVKCTEYMENKELTSERGANLDTPSRMRMSATDEDSRGHLKENLPTSLGNEGNSMKKTITTTLGTVAGASTILTLLYKVNRKFHFNL
ncbi:hypothetical protein PVBG_05940 [Plasmodium vivax Brazil I]|uniref:Variable surface protein n=1 Tax=Plasmodium vivax (strain Brazil I) TaxID=1033975 RepID=A0A0J9VBB9_PLAV1|nr:hypothetical protein PVBG_05940 [Plasmodium vivax Brazil I]